MSEAIGSEWLSLCYKVMVYCPSHIIFVMRYLLHIFWLGTQHGDCWTTMGKYLAINEKEKNKDGQ